MGRRIHIQDVFIPICQLLFINILHCIFQGEVSYHLEMKTLKILYWKIFIDDIDNKHLNEWCLEFQLYLEFFQVANGDVIKQPLIFGGR